MSTAAQLEANRSNAQLSTGPVSAEGKSTSSQNALKHGLSATSIAAFSPEIRSEYIAFRATLEAEIQPESANEQAHFEQYAFSLFLSVRAQAMEANALEAHMADPDNPQKEQRLSRATRYVRAKVSAARSALKQIQVFQSNRLALAEIEEIILYGHEAEVLAPIATPLHLLLDRKSQRHTKEGAAALLYLANLKSTQNEANPTLSATGQ